MACFKLEREITNMSSSFDLIVKIKGGLSYIIRKVSEASYESDQFVTVTLREVYVESIRIDPDEALTKLDTEIMLALKAEVDRVRNSNEFFHKDLVSNITVRVKLTANMAGEHNGIHSEMLGMTLYSGSGNKNRGPLNVPTTTLLNAISSFEEGNPRSAIYYCAYINDPKRTQRTFYVNLVGRATEVPVVHNDSENAGLYIGLSTGNKPPETIYYAFDSLTKDLLEGLGVFDSKSEALKGGNTERYVEAEAKIKNLSKELDNKNQQLKDSTVKLDKLERQLDETVQTMTFMKQDHKNSLDRLKLDAVAAGHKHSRYEISSKEEVERNKFEMRNKEFHAKYILEQTKQKSNLSGWGELLKGVSTFLGVIFTGFKLLTS